METKYSNDGDEILVRKNQDNGTWYWADPADGSPVGTRSSEYARFESEAEARSEAKRLNYTVVEE